MTRAQHRRILLVGAILPIAVGLVGAVVILVALPDVPDPVAIHWGVSGRADGFGPAWVNLAILVPLVLAYSAFALLVSRGATFSVPQRILLVTAPFLAVFLTCVLAGSLWMQRGLEQAEDAPNVSLLILVGALGGAGAAVVSWLLLPSMSRDEHPDAAVPTLDLSPTERAVWMRSTGPSGLPVFFILGTLVLVSAVTIVALVLSAPILVAALYSALLVLIALLVAGTVFWRARVTAEGLVVRSALGIPRFAVPLSDVDTATVTDVQPVRDFGGWGLRWGGPGRFGVVTRAGEALEVRRRNGKALIVTVDDAGTAAALLNSLVRRDTME